MRCAEVGRLVDRYVDGGLPAGQRAGIERHARACAACRVLVAEAREVRRRLAAEAAVAAPRGFADRVMDRVWREALWAPRLAPDGAAGRSAARGYRRLGLSVMLGAAVLIALLALPRIVGVGSAGGWAEIAERVIAGADGAVRGTLDAAGGPAARIIEGGTR